MSLLVMLAVVGAVALWYALRRVRPPETPAGRLRRLRARYRQLVHLPQDEADAALDRHIDALRRRFPGKSLAWYVKRVIADLDWDRR